MGLTEDICMFDLLFFSCGKGFVSSNECIVCLYPNNTKSLLQIIAVEKAWIVGGRLYAKMCGVVFMICMKPVVACFRDPI
jgi:hypothetical protein